MAMLLPYGLEYNHHKNGHLTAELLSALSDAETYARTPHDERSETVIRLIREMNAALHQACDGRFPRFLKEARNADGEFAVPIEALSRIARTAMDDGTLLFNPEELDREDFMMVLEHAWDGRPLDRSLIHKGP